MSTPNKKIIDLVAAGVFTENDIRQHASWIFSSDPSLNYYNSMGRLRSVHYKRLNFESLSPALQEMIVTEILNSEVNDYQYRNAIGIFHDTA